MDFKRLNTIGGWAVFLVAITVYVLTLEPTVSFWDCGEYIATSNKLEVGHPPGAPLFMMLGRVFSAFVPVESAAWAVNFLSALSSAFTVLFLFWTISAIGRLMAMRIASREGISSAREALEKGAEAVTLTAGQNIAILGSAAIGALAYTFTDSFWFSAVEGEVYAMSSMFTAITFWAIFRWERAADEPHADRWLILIAYLIGLSIGVHLLNLLCIPAIAYVYYYKKFTPSTQGFIITGVVSVVLLGLVQNVLIPGLVSMASGFELFFTNSMGLPFNVGTIIYAALILTFIIGGIKLSHSLGRPKLATGILCFTVLVIGYSSFGMILVRSNANTPMDQNNPENTIRLLSYLEREQYGSWPLLYGQYFNTPLDPEKPYVDGNPVYFKDEENGKYSIADDRKGGVPNYDKEFCGFFPRMWRSEPNRKTGYISWTNFKGSPKKSRTRNPDGSYKTIYKPTFGENMSFFMQYQIGWMYWRYFMWNFSGRQNDVQGHGGVLNGNWQTGLDFIDEARLGPQDEMPYDMGKNKGKNSFYLIPLILGLLGMIYHFIKDSRYAFVTLMLFLFTGLMIVIYLNQGPFEPRERDYAFAASFYAFAIWIGLGVYAIYDFAVNGNWKDFGRVMGIAVGTGAFIFLLELMMDNSHYFSTSVLWMVLVGGAMLAIAKLVAQNAKGVAVAGIAILLALPAPVLLAMDGWDDHDRSNRTTAWAMARNYLDSCAPNAILFSMGDNDTFPLWYLQEVEEYRTDVRVVNLSYLGIDWYIDQMHRRAYESAPLPLSLQPEQYRQGTRDFVVIDNTRNKDELHVDAKRLMSFIANPQNVIPIGNGDKEQFIPTRHFSIPVDADKVIELGVVSPDKRSQIVPEVRWSMSAGKRILSKSEMVILDLLANNDWERPIYFTTTIGRDGYFALTDYFQIDGFCYRLVPIKNTQPSGQLLGSVDTKILGPNLMEKFEWGNVDTDTTLYLDHTNTRLLGNIRMYFLQLAEAYAAEGKNEEAIRVLDHCLEKLPGSVISFNYIANRFCQVYYQLGEIDKGNALAIELLEAHAEKMEYYLTFDAKHQQTFVQDFRMQFTILNDLYERTAKPFLGEDVMTKTPARFADNGFEKAGESVTWAERYKTIEGKYAVQLGMLKLDQ